jgi:hypothetical protein
MMRECMLANRRKREPPGAGAADGSDGSNYNARQALRVRSPCCFRLIPKLPYPARIYKPSGDGPCPRPFGVSGRRSCRRRPLPAERMNSPQQPHEVRLRGLPDRAPRRLPCSGPGSRRMNLNSPLGPRNVGLRRQVRHGKGSTPKRSPSGPERSERSERVQERGPEANEFAAGKSRSPPARTGPPAWSADVHGGAARSVEASFAERVSARRGLSQSQRRL